MPILYLLFVLLAALLQAPVLSAAPAPAARHAAAASNDNWIVIPEGFMVSYLAVAPGVPVRTYRVVVDVLPSVSVKKCNPRVTRSCGDEAVDAIAVDYVRAMLRLDKKLAANLSKYTLAFQLEVRPHVPAKLEPAGPRPPGAPKDAYLTPKPGYPFYSRVHQDTGIGEFRVSFGPRGGRPREVAMLRSTGNEVLDANFILYALSHWEAPNPPPKLVITKTIEYRLNHHPASNAPTNPYDRESTGPGGGILPAYENAPPSMSMGAGAGSGPQR